MDNDNNQQQEQKQSSIDRVNDLIDKARSARNSSKRARAAYRIYKNIRRARAAATVIRGGVTAAQGTGAVTGAVASSEIWVPVLVFFLIVLLFFVLLVAIIGGISSNTPTCEKISASSTSASVADPVIITLDNCSENAIFSWSESLGGGVFTPGDAQSTTYTPPSVKTSSASTITGTICGASTPDLCSEYVIDINITASDCSSLGGVCTSSGICSAEEGKVVAGVFCGENQVCCNVSDPSQGVKFYCQYGAVNSNGALASGSYGSWNYKQTQNGRTCEIAAAGCTPTSFAMVLSSLGYTISPTQVSKLNRRITDPLNINENIGCRGTKPRPGTSWEDIYFSGGVRDWVKSLGFSMTPDLTGPDMSLSTLQTLDSYINNGCFVVAGANIRFAYSEGLYGSPKGHAFMISDVDVANRSVTAYDPTFCRPPYVGGKRTLTNVTSFGTGVSSVNGWIFVSAICKK